MDVLGKTTFDHFINLRIPSDKSQVMYVWVDGTGITLRSKTRTVNFTPKSPKGNRLGKFSHKTN